MGNPDCGVDPECGGIMGVSILRAWDILWEY